MTLGGLTFLAALLVASAVFPFLPTVRLRQVFLAAWSLFFLSRLIPNQASWLLLAVFVGSGWLLGTALSKRPSRLLLASYLAVLVTAFVLLKKYGFLSHLLPEFLLAHPIAIVGLSYILFRQIHFVVDCREGQIARVSLWDYANYQLNLFSLLAGPIQRYQDFLECWGQLQPCPRNMHELLRTWQRILWGVLKMAGVGAVLYSAYCSFRDDIAFAEVAGVRPLLPTLLQFAAIFYLYPLYMYANFSGYCDIAIGSAALMGLRLPENFDRPYLARNIIDFWTRWHRTLGFWIRDYLFMPLYKAGAERRGAAVPSWAFACYFVAFVLAGVWHGTTANFLAFGVLHGVGASAAKLWETHLVRHKGRAYLKQYLQSRTIRTVAIIATLNYFAISMFFFADSLPGSFRTLGIVARSVSAALQR